MRKLFILVLIIVCSIFPLFSKDISAKGYGNTIEEAQANAKNALAMSVFPVQVDSTMTSSYSTSGGSAFSQESSSRVYGQLANIEFEPVSLTEEEKKNARYGYLAILRDDKATVTWYSDKAEEARKNVEYYYGRISGSTVDKKKEYYRLILDSYEEYNSSRQVLLKLGYDVQKINIDKTYSILWQEYESALTEYDNYYNEKQNELNAQASEEARKLIEQNRKEMEILQEQKESARQQQEMLRNAELMEQIDRYVGSAEKLAVGAFGTSISGFGDMCDDLKKSISEFRAICSEYDSMIASENSRIDDEIKAEAEAIRNREYRTGQLDSKGKPVEGAVAWREQEVEEMKKEKEKERASVLSFIDSSLQPVIQNSYDHIASTISKFSETSFSDSVSGGGLKVTNKGYDASSFSWSLTVSGVFHKRTLSMDIKLKYSDLTGVPESEIDVNDSKYNDNVDLYKEMLNSGKFWIANDIVLDFEAKIMKDGINLSLGKLTVYLGSTNKTYDVEIGKQYQLNESFHFLDSRTYGWLRTSDAISSITIASAPVITDYGYYAKDAGYHVVSIDCATSDTTIYYSTDDSTPTNSSQSYSKNYSMYETVKFGARRGILVPLGTTVKAIGTADGYWNSDVTSMAIMDESLTIATPVITDCGAYSGDSSFHVINISCSTPHSAIYYSLGADSDPSKRLYYYPATYHQTKSGSQQGILVPTGSVLKAIGVGNGYNDSEIAVFTVEGKVPRVATPEITNHGEMSQYSDSESLVSIECDTAGAVIHYTLDGTSPDAGSPVYSPGRYQAADGSYVMGIRVAKGSTVKAMAIQSGFTDSKVTSKDIDFPRVATPVIKDNGFEEDYDYHIVSITSKTPYVSIKYTTDGTNPQTSPSAGFYFPSTYTGENGKDYTGILVTPGTTVKAMGVKLGFQDSKVTSKKIRGSSSSSSDSDSSGFSEWFKNAFNIRLNAGLSLSLDPAPEDETDPPKRAGFLTSADLYFEFGRLIGIGCSPYYWHTDTDANLFGVDLLFVLDYHNILVNGLWSDYSEDVTDDITLYSDIRIGLRKDSTPIFKITVLGLDLSFLNISSGLIVEYGHSAPLIFFSLGYKFGFEDDIKDYYSSR